MKKSILVLAAVIVAFTETSGKSNEEKAAEELIKQELSQVLYDFESYEPIATVVAEAKDIPTNNDGCIRQARTAIGHLERVNKHLKDVTSARKNMNYWGPPTRNSSSYSDSKYYESKKDYVLAMIITNVFIKLYNSTIDDLETMMKNTKPTETIGYNVVHSFYYRTKSGFLTVANCRFVTDKNFERIIFIEVIGNDLYNATDLIKSVQNGCGKIDTLDWKKYTK